MAERMIDAGHANAAQNHAGGAPLVGATGQGMGGGAAAKAVSVSSATGKNPHGMLTALAGIIEGTIIEGAKNNIAAINIVLTILRKFMVVPLIPLPRPISRR